MHPHVSPRARTLPVSATLGWGQLDYLPTIPPSSEHAEHRTRNSNIAVKGALQNSIVQEMRNCLDV